MTDSIEERLTALEHRVDAVAEIAMDALEIAEQNQERVHEIANSVEGMSDTLTLLNQVRENTASRREQRIAQCLITLKNGALRGASNASSLDASAMIHALGGDVDRTVTYDLMRYIAEAVGDESVCWKETHPRNSSKNTRVVLDLDAGDIPAFFAGIDLHSATIEGSHDG